MAIFLIVFFLIYGGINTYAFLKARAAFDFDLYVSLPLGLFLALMVMAPLLVRILEGRGMEPLAQSLAWVGYVWMGLIFLFFCAAVVVDLVSLLAWGANAIAGDRLSFLVPSALVRFLVPAAVALGVGLYSLYEAGNLQVETVVIRTSKIPPEVGKVTIVQITDVHLGVTLRQKALNRILDRVRRAQPDLLVSTGDLLDGDICRIDGLVERFRDIQPKYGKFAVTGNHEFYAGVEMAVRCMEEAGFNVLRGERVEVDGVLSVAGVDDPQGKSFDNYAGISERDLLTVSNPDTAGGASDRFSLLLKHQPVVDSAAVGLFDLQLSGHTHKGQIFPFSLLVKMAYPRYGGYYRLPKDSRLYTSRGTGTWGPPMRFLSPPEVTVFHLVAIGNSTENDDRETVYVKDPG
ncbi:MAG: metallophosphoesterase [Candidatus Zixiibacteriota bacterium]|nr:MAG: metallophosphoesterase [candidate division Zixibacteria bacterium]